MSAFEKLKNNLTLHLLSSLEKLFFKLEKSEEYWWGGVFLFRKNDRYFNFIKNRIYFKIVYDTLHTQLTIELGPFSGTSYGFPYELFLQAADYNLAEYKYACGFWDKGGLWVGDMPKAFGIVAETLPHILQNYKKLIGEVKRISKTTPAS